MIRVRDWVCMIPYWRNCILLQSMPKAKTTVLGSNVERIMNAKFRILPTRSSIQGWLLHYFLSGKIFLSQHLPILQPRDSSFTHAVDIGGKRAQHLPFRCLDVHVHNEPLKNDTKCHQVRSDQVSAVQTAHLLFNGPARMTSEYERPGALRQPCSSVS
ncbi:uncharacterized protein K460DRAFT_85289 [Cucurbitaria berberidis CBS 394.84]|uniref:Uncharacterized protein n=1 Tax=Cucurbitaria berberidis CBS 394.84 TaxID=1168544 RepID=A0A9P4GP26_9PLEO|nr:uncharacterized protein K460DRAFT_85289 [Cucurbitaria berberidis CBS 394.84]KAF1849120.1 hypothetical protein K460DRAFT_85289 [Cucurbitaria berberidis CBS 394.84]